MNPLAKKLDEVSNGLESKGLFKEATEIDEVANALDIEASETVDAVLSDVIVEGSGDFSDVDGAEEMIAASRYYVDEAMEEVEAADRELEAAKQKKKKWLKGIVKHKGRLTKYRKENESMEQAARRAMRSDDPSLRGAAGMYLALHGKKKEMEAAATEANSNRYNRPMVEAKELPHVKDRPSPIFPKGSPKVKDDFSHFPIPDESHGQNALARVNQYGSVPSWYDGSLEELKAAVVKAVESKFPKMEVEKEKFEPED
jgi:hypothetical protein